MTASQKLENQRLFYIAYGRAMAQWARIEAELCHWFRRITHMDSVMATAVFYSAQSFSARSRMLEAAISTAISIARLNGTEAEFIKAARKKAKHYSSFRNKLAHRQTTHFYASDMTPPEGTWMLIEGTDIFSGLLATEFTGIDLNNLDHASINFKKLANLLRTAFWHHELGEQFTLPEKAASLEMYLEQVHALPKEPELVS